MPRRSRPTTHRDHPGRIGPPVPRPVVALGAWAVAVATAGVLALQLAGGPAAADGDREAVAATAAASAPVTIQLASSVATTAPAAPTTTEAPTTTTAPPPPPEAAPVEPAPRSAPTTADTTPPPVVEAPPATEPPPPAPAPEPAPAPAVGSDVDAAGEAMLLDDHNRRRAEAGLPPLVRNACLDEVARDWARQMAASTTMRHNPNLGAAIDRCIAYTAAGENVGHGPDVGVLAARFWESDSHRANILGPYEYVGIGVVHGPDGARWAALEFAAD